MKIKAFKYEENQFVLEDVEISPSSKATIGVRIEAFGLNRADISLAKGEYPASGIPSSHGAKFGLEFAGIIDETSEVSKFQVGDRVCGLVTGGAFAQYIYCEEHELVRLPQNFEIEVAASIPESFGTAILNLELLHEIKASENILIHSAGGGVGQAAIQLAAKKGAFVIASAGAESKLSFAKDLGASEVLNYRAEGYGRLLETYSDRIQTIFDTVGASLLELHLKLLSRQGRLLSIGLLGGQVATLNLGYLLYKNVTLSGSTLKSQNKVVKDEIRSRLQLLIDTGFSTGEFRETVWKVYSYNDINEAVSALIHNKNCGNIVVSWN